MDAPGEGWFTTGGFTVDQLVAAFDVSAVEQLTASGVTFPFSVAARGGRLHILVPTDEDQ